jgi:hypothetical protein
MAGIPPRLPTNFSTKSHFLNAGIPPRLPTNFSTKSHFFNGRYSSSASNQTRETSKYLCSGGFIGSSNAVAEIFRRYPISEFSEIYPDKSEQFYWAVVWHKEWLRAEVVYNISKLI